LASVVEDAPAQVAVFLSDGSALRSLAESIESADDAEVLNLFVTAASFGDPIIAHLVAARALEEVHARIVDVRNERVMKIVMKLVAEWATHTVDYVEPLLVLVRRTGLEWLLESSFGLKEAAVHAIRIMLTRLSSAQTFELIGPGLFTGIVDLLPDCDGGSPMTYEVCRLIRSVFDSARGREDALPFVRSVVGAEHIVRRIHAIADSDSPRDVRECARSIVYCIMPEG